MGILPDDHNLRLIIPPTESLAEIDKKTGVESAVQRGICRTLFHWRALASRVKARARISPAPSLPQSQRSLPTEWRAGAHLRQPSLFVLGTAKCGTTAFHHYLSQHPDIFMSNPKEPFFFEAEYHKGPEFYFNRYFRDWTGERIAGESRHRNLYLPFVPKRIHSYNPNAKFIAILRNPVERAVSHWWHWHSRSLEQLPLEEALKSDQERIESGAGLQSASEIEFYSSTLDPYGKGSFRTYLDSGYYYDQLERYMSRFGRNRILIILHDDFSRCTCEVVAKAFEFLECDPSVVHRISFDRINQSAPGMVEHVDSHVMAWLVNHFRPYNRRLESLLDVDLSVWDSPFSGSGS
jgi:hypothetical protein